MPRTDDGSIAVLKKRGVICIGGDLHDHVRFLQSFGQKDNLAKTENLADFESGSLPYKNSVSCKILQKSSCKFKALSALTGRSSKYLLLRYAFLESSKAYDEVRRV